MIGVRSLLIGVSMSSRPPFLDAASPELDKWFEPHTRSDWRAAATKMLKGKSLEALRSSIAALHQLFVTANPILRASVAKSFKALQSGFVASMAQGAVRTCSRCASTCTRACSIG